MVRLARRRFCVFVRALWWCLTVYAFQLVAGVRLALSCPSCCGFGALALNCFCTRAVTELNLSLIHI